MAEVSVEHTIEAKTTPVKEFNHLENGYCGLHGRLHTRARYGISQQ